MDGQEDKNQDSVEGVEPGSGDDPGSNGSLAGPGRSVELDQARESTGGLEALEETGELDPELEEIRRLTRQRAEIERRMRELEDPERTMLRQEMAERALELHAIEEAERQRVVSEALGKFGVFMHLTAYMTGVAYLVLLAVFVPKSVPWVFIPVVLWTVGICYHFWRAWHPLSPEENALTSLEEEEKDGRETDGKRRRRAR